MRYFDCHADTLTEIPEPDEDLWKNTCDVDLSRVKQFAEQYTQIFAIWLNREKINQKNPEAEFRKAYARAEALLQKQTEQGRLIWCKTGTEMEKAHTDGKAAAFLSIEDASIMGEDVCRMRELGFRFALLTWNFENEYGCGASTDQKKGLTLRGKELAEELLRQGIVIDISHLSDRGAEDLFTLTEQPVMASHSNVREICGMPRNLPKEYIQELIRRKGLLGMNFFRNFVGEEPEKTDITDILRHMDAVLELGGEHILALGGDFDGCSGRFPKGMCNVSSVPALRAEMEKAGFGEELTEKIFFENARRFVIENVR